VPNPNGMWSLENELVYCRPQHDHHVAFDVSPPRAPSYSSSKLKDAKTKKLKLNILVVDYKLIFETINNTMEYETLLLSLEYAREKGIKQLKVLGDTELVVN